MSYPHVSSNFATTECESGQQHLSGLLGPGGREDPQAQQPEHGYQGDEATFCAPGEVTAEIGFSVLAG